MADEPGRPRGATQIGPMRRTEAPDPGPPPPEEVAPPRVARGRGVGPFSLRQVTLAIGVVAIGAVLLTLSVQPLGSINPGLPVPEPSAYLLGNPIPGLNPGDAAPELAGTHADGSAWQLTDLNGNPIRLADLRGKVVWLNFWTSWCSPCQAETPLLRSMDQTYRSQGLALIGVQVQQTVADGKRYAQTYNLGYTIGADVSADAYRTYKAFALPTHFFIDQHGIVRLVVNGPLDVASATAIVRSLLGLPPLPPPSNLSPGPS